MGKKSVHVRILYCLLISLMIAVLALACCSCGKKKGDGTTKSFNPDTVAAIDAEVAAAMEGSEAPGALVGIWLDDGTMLVKAYGQAYLEPEQAMGEDMIFRIGSITKTFTADLALQLTDEGLLSLDDPVSRFVSDVPDGGNITVRMLLNHSSGLFNYGADDALNEALAADPHKVWKPEELVAAGVANPPYFAPGEGCMYSNTNYVLLGMIIEKVTGITVDEALAERIAGPLGMEETSMAEDYRMPEGGAGGFMYDEESGELLDITEYLDPSIVWTAGGMISTLEDLHAWGRALAGGQLLSPDTGEAVTSGMLDLPYMEEYFGYPIEYGLGIMDCGGWLGHSGMQPGYSSAVFNLPARGATIVVLLNVSNLEEPGMRLFMRLAKTVFPDETPW